MCLGIPARIEEIRNNKAIADFGGVRREIRIDLIDDLKVGDYVIVHVGFAIEKLDEKEAMESLKIWQALIEKNAHGI